MKTRSVAEKAPGAEDLRDHGSAFLVPAKATQELRTFELPKSIWWTMFLAYTVFFLGLAIATGRDLSALFVIVISACYAIMYFGTAAVMNAVGTQGRPATIPGDIDTATGKLSYGAAFAQILTVPLVIAIFGCAITVIWTIVAP